jgi:ketosteroid isomerase-like protein
MNTEDKAKQIAWEYLAIVGDTDMAKQCALICVDLVLENIMPIGARSGTERAKEIYWQEVKEKIKLLK